MWSRFKDSMPMGLIIAGSATLLLLLLMGLTLVAVDRLAGEATRELIGSRLTGIAQNVRAQLDVELGERVREMRLFAHMDAALANDDNRDIRRLQFLDALKRANTDYAWIGVTDTNGRIAQAAGGLLTGVDVSGRNWFLEGRKGAFLGDVHEAKLLAKLVPSPDGEPLRFLDVAVPVIGDDGDYSGVVAAHLHSSWANRVVSAAAPQAQADGIKIIVVDRTGTVIFGSADFRGLSLAGSQALRTAQGGGKGYATEDIAARGAYLVGFAPPMDIDQADSLGWIVMAAHPVRLAYAPVVDLRHAVVLIGITLATLGAIVTYLQVRRHIRPLEKLTAAARRIGIDPRNAQPPEVDGSIEILALSDAIKSLLRRLSGYEAELQANEERLQSLQADNAENKRLADTDPMTGAMNRRAFFRYAERACLDGTGAETPVIAVLDIDHFKLVNDTYGHAAGDDVICAVARSIAEDIPVDGVLSRFGGEEFVVLLPSADLSIGQRFCEHIREKVATTPIRAGATNIWITVSVGVAQITPWCDLGCTIDQADQALYVAKRGGRNRVALAA